jgi:transcriptional regulator with PAS, ATPase and Fis domain
MILLDLQFNTGECDEDGVPVPTQTDREKLFGINILERTWKDESLRDIPVIVLTQLKRNQIENKVQEEFSKFDVVWEVVSKNELNKDKLIELLMDYALLSGPQVVQLLETMYINNKSTEAPLIIGHSLTLLKALRETRNVARKTDMDVMILGETGVGKELFARLIHCCSKRKDQPFKAINCAAIPGHLFEVELFGYMAGSFTDAGKQGKPGLLESVKDGTFFLDEVGDLSLKHQAKLLRVIQNREFFRIGGIEPIPLKARLIYATNRDLKEAVKNKKFRRDLDFRINFPPIIIPPLRERQPGDIKLLARHFIKLYQKKFNKKHLRLALHESAEKKLYQHPWRGNVRELEYVIMKAVYRKSISIISPKDLELLESSFPGISIEQLLYSIKDCQFEHISYDDLDNTLDDIQRFIIHLLNASVKVYIKENRRGKFIIDDDENISINITGLMKQLTGLDRLSTISAKRLFENLCDILPGGLSKKHVDQLAGKDKIFKKVLEKVSK